MSPGQGSDARMAGVSGGRSFVSPGRSCAATLEAASPAGLCIPGSVQTTACVRIPSLRTFEFLAPPNRLAFAAVGDGCGVVVGIHVLKVGPGWVSGVRSDHEQSHLPVGEPTYRRNAIRGQYLGRSGCDRTMAEMIATTGIGLPPRVSPGIGERVPAWVD